MLLHKEYVEYAIENLKRNGAQEVFGKIYDANHPIVVETHIESWDDPFYQTRYFQLHYRLTVVSYRHIEVPVFTFTNHSGVVEWKCPACGMINNIEASFCGEKHDNACGCGRPREKTRQWYEANYMGDWQ